jgi:hypothetical protein
MIESYIKVEHTTTHEIHTKSLNQSVIYVGPQAADSITLQESQALGDNGRLLIRPAGQAQFGYTLLNLSTVPVSYYPYVQSDQEQTRVLANGETVALKDRDFVAFGQYRLTFFAGDHDTETIKLQIDLTNTRLVYDTPLTGTVKVVCASERTIQPILKIIGLPHRVIPGAQVSNSEKGIPIKFEIHHPKAPVPVSGIYMVTFQVTEPKIFPGKYAAATRAIQVEPYLEHRLTLKPSLRTSGNSGWIKTLVERFK